MLVALISLLLVADTRELSEALGHWIGKNLQQLPLDFEAVAKGMQDEAEGRQSPMDETACLQAVGELEAEQKAEQVRQERAKAEEFLQEHQKKEGVHALAEGQVQYEVVHEGTGETVRAYNSPIVRMGNNPPESLSFDSLSEGLRLGLESMREGEIRTLFIHPDLAGTDGLQTVEIELIQADVQTPEEEIPLVR